MSIKVVCPNGHEIRVKDSNAGKTGLCPMCKARVTVPEIERSPLSEEDVMGLLGEPAAADSGSISVESMAEASEGDYLVEPTTKICKVCEREIEAESHICKYCNTYIGDD